LLVVKNPVAFASRYNITGLNVAPGGFLGQLNNAGETIELSDTNGIVFLSVTYGDADPWPSEADGTGSSLEVRNAEGNLNDPTNWRASPEASGSPGRPGGDALGTVIINEALTHTDAPVEDAIEIFNRTSQPIDVGGWFLSDSRALSRVPHPEWHRRGTTGLPRVLRDRLQHQQPARAVLAQLGQRRSDLSLRC
jgi:hypothetical protein